ncbi:MAG: hypothetical protein Q4E69_04970 [Bacilli bacterium]|nr:hypothetical protein [Bacilli bacterium]
MANKELTEKEKYEHEKNKLLLSAENVLGFTSCMALFSTVIAAAYGDFSDPVKAVYIASGATAFVVGAGYAVKIEQKAGYYRCSRCGYEYVPEKYLKVFFAPHMGKNRLMECPRCGEKGWQKKVTLKKEIDKRK